MFTSFFFPYRHGHLQVVKFLVNEAKKCNNFPFHYFPFPVHSYFTTEYAYAYSTQLSTVFQLCVFQAGLCTYRDTYVRRISCWNKFFRTGRLRSYIYVRTYAHIIYTYVHVRAGLVVMVSALENIFQSCPE